MSCWSWSGGRVFRFVSERVSIRSRALGVDLLGRDGDAAGAALALDEPVQRHLVDDGRPGGLGEQRADGVPADGLAIDHDGDAPRPPGAPLLPGRGIGPDGGVGPVEPPMDVARLVAAATPAGRTPGKHRQEHDSDPAAHCVHGHHCTPWRWGRTTEAPEGTEVGLHW